MKVPFPSTQNNQSPIVKPYNSSRNTACYEPKSVLDLRGSPSPTPSPIIPTDKAATKSEIPEDDGSIQWEEHNIPNNFEDWDSLMRELALNDEYVPAQLTQFPSLPDFPPSHSFDSTITQFNPTDFALSDVTSNQIPNHNFDFFDLSAPDFNNLNHNYYGFNFVDELIRAADSLESSEFNEAHMILARLNHQLRSPAGKPLQRAAFYFKEALQALLPGSTRPSRDSYEVVQAIKAYKNFSNVSPIAMFSNFTANQAILEAVMDGSMFVHVIDFEIGFGGQWASFMREIADSADSRKVNKPVIRITAVVSEEYGVESRLIRENLNQFARELKIGFEIEFVLDRTFEFLSFKAIKFMEGEKIAVLLSPAIFHRLGAGFVSDLRRIPPHVVVLVDDEGLTDAVRPSFRRSVIDGLEFFSTVLESLEAATLGGGGGGGDDWIRRIEVFLLRPKIFAAVGAAGRRAPPWREAFAAVGLRPVGLSQFADFQAECLLRKVQVRGFHVAKRQAEMVLCWHERALVATSAWRC